MKIIICEDVFLNEKEECCYTDEFINKYPEYNEPKYFLGIGNEGIRMDKGLINALESFGIEKAIKPIFSHHRMYIGGWNNCTVKPVGNYINPIKIVDIPDSTTDLEINYLYNEDGNPEYENVIYVVDGKIHHI